MCAIYALSTCYGKSAIAIIRINGNNALKVINDFSIKKILMPRVTILAEIFEIKTRNFIEQGF